MVRQACDLRGSADWGRRMANLGYRERSCLKHKEGKKEKVKM